MEYKCEIMKIHSQLPPKVIFARQVFRFIYFNFRLGRFSQCLNIEPPRFQGIQISSNKPSDNDDLLSQF